MKKFSFTLLIMLLSGLITSANALTFNAIKDENAHNRSAGDPFGSDVILAPAHLSNYDILTYISFDITSFNTLGLPAADVSFDLYGRGNRTNLALTIYGLNDNVTSPAWAESANGQTLYNGSNFPGVDSNFNIVPTDVTQLFSGPVSYTLNSLINFTGINFTNFINADTDNEITLILALEDNTVTTNHAFHSKDASENLPPTLNITPVPLPAAVWFFVSALMGLVSFRRKEKV